MKDPLHLKQKQIWKSIGMECLIFDASLLGFNNNRFILIDHIKWSILTKQL